LEAPYDAATRKARIRRCRLLADGRLRIEHEKVISVCTPRLFYCGRVSPAEDDSRSRRTSELVALAWPLETADGFVSRRLETTERFVYSYNPSDEGIKHVEMACESESDQVTRELLAPEKEDEMLTESDISLPSLSRPVAKRDATLLRKVRESCVFVAMLVGWILLVALLCHMVLDGRIRSQGLKRVSLVV